MLVRRLGAWSFVILAVLGVDACAAANGSDTEVRPEDHQITVQVDNHNWSDMVVYAVRNGGLKVRLGLVPSMQGRRFTLPDAVGRGNARLRLLADPIGSSRTFLSPGFVLWPGDEAMWALENHLALSTLTVR